MGNSVATCEVWVRRVALGMLLVLLLPVVLGYGTILVQRLLLQPLLRGLG